MARPAFFHLQALFVFLAPYLIIANSGTTPITTAAIGANLGLVTFAHSKLIFLSFAISLLIQCEKTDRYSYDGDLASPTIVRLRRIFVPAHLNSESATRIDCDAFNDEP